MRRVGSLFSGIGGLDRAVCEVLDGKVSWFVENDPAASAVLAARWPDVLNLGDVTGVDWSVVPPVDVLCGGSPCQDISTAGRQGGIAEGTRSGLWFAYLKAISVIRPEMVVFENVDAIRSVRSPGMVEPCETCMGIDPQRQSGMRALGIVLGGLADLGYDAEWTSVRASDVGYCHRRQRIFLVAWPAANSADNRRAGPRSAW